MAARSWNGEMSRIVRLNRLPFSCLRIAVYRTPMCTVFVFRHMMFLNCGLATTVCRRFRNVHGLKNYGMS